MFLCVCVRKTRGCSRRARGARDVPAAGAALTSRPAGAAARRARGARPRGGGGGGGGGREVCAWLRSQRGSCRGCAGLVEPPGPAVSPLGPGPCPGQRELPVFVCSPPVTVTRGDRPATSPAAEQGMPALTFGMASDPEVIPRCRTEPLAPSPRLPPPAWGSGDRSHLSHGMGGDGEFPGLERLWEGQCQEQVLSGCRTPQGFRSPTSWSPASRK